MPRIQLLSDLLVNKIAAGEVIERPASVVKELIENSLDAGATRIEIHIERGGRRLIRVVDNGSGMGSEDLALSVRPHATSKITREEDLFAIQTMGFRGEALPSIGAVSQLKVISRTADADAGHQIAVCGDRVEPLTAASAPCGSTVEVRELFFNVPARQKFLRTDPTEMGHITEQLARIALVHPHVEFRLTHNDRVVHHLRASEGMRRRIGDFFGHDLADTLLEIRRADRGLTLSGFAALPADSRSTTKWQYLFLNGRYIRDRFVAHAIREAYRGLIEAHRYPVVFLAMQIDPAAVDVNVHPTKMEVRWRDSNLLYSQILSALRDRFLNADLTPALQPGRRGPLVLPVGEEGSEDAGATDTGTPTLPLRGADAGTSDSGELSEEDAAARRERIRTSIADFFKRAQPVGGGAEPRPYQPFPGAFRRETGPRSADLIANQDRAAGGSPSDEVNARAAAEDDAGVFAARAASGEPFPARPDRVLQVHRTYLVAETEDGLLIIDQHALHERILFEQLAAQVARGPLESQRMLIPDTLDVSPDQMSVLDNYDDALKQLGFELTPYGPGTVAIHAAPTLLRDDRMRDFLRDLLDKLAVRAGPASTELLTNDLLSMMACKAAVKAGDPLTPEEIQALMARRHEVERSSNCPHGRPTSLRLTIRDLERQFKRA